MLISSSASPQQVSSDFTTLSATDGCGSLVVEFQDLSTGNPNSWLWDLGNGNTSSQKNPIAVYSLPGLYNVSLTVSDGITYDTKTEISFVSVFLPHIALLVFQGLF